MNRKALLLYSVCLAVLVGALIWVYHIDGYSTVKKTTKDEPIVVTSEERIPREKITAKAEDSERVYLFYEKSSLMNVYKKDGTFLYGISIYSGQNGAGNIAVIDHVVYVKPMDNVIYRFQEMQLLDQTAYSYSDSVAGDHRFHDMESAMEAANLSAENQSFLLDANGWTLLDVKTKQPVPFLPENNGYASMIISCIGLFILAVVMEIDKKKDN